MRATKRSKTIRLILAKNPQRQQKAESGEDSQVKSPADSQRLRLPGSDLTTRRVIIGVLGMLFILPLFEVDGGYYGQLSTFDTGGLAMMHQVAGATGPNSTAVEHAVDVSSL